MMSPKYLSVLSIVHAIRKARRRVRKVELIVHVERDMNVRHVTAREYIESMIRIGVLKDLGEDVEITLEGEKYVARYD